ARGEDQDVARTVEAGGPGPAQRLRVDLRAQAGQGNAGRTAGGGRRARDLHRPVRAKRQGPADTRLVRKARWLNTRRPTGPPRLPRSPEARKRPGTAGTL